MCEEKKLLSKKIGYPVFMLIGFFFVFFWKSEKDLAESGNILWTSGYMTQILLLSIILGAVLGSALCFLLYAVSEGKFRRKLMGKSNIKALGKDGPGYRIEAWLDKRSGVQRYFLVYLFILLCWLPVYLAYYPGICAYDTPIQLEQIFENAWNAHHPIVHTLLLSGFIGLGKNVFGDINTGIGLFTAFQLLFLAAAFAYGIVTLRHFLVRPLWQVLALLYCMFYPFHLYMAVSLTKDTIFTGFVLLMTVSLCKMLLEERNELRINRTDVSLLASTVGVILFRNNGKYALLVSVVFLLITVIFGKKKRKLWERILGDILIAFLLGNLVLSAVFKLTGAVQGDRREMLSLPIQQLARTMVYHGGVGLMPTDDNTMRDEDRAIINEFLLDQAYLDYDADFTDPVKRHTNTYVVRYRFKEFVSTYLHLLTEYPGDFINAGLAVNAGYLYPNDISHSQINIEEGRTGRGYIQTYWFEPDLTPRGLYKDSKWEWLHGILENWADRNAYLNFPILKYIFVPGSYLYVYLVWAGYLLIRKKYRLLLPLSFVWGYYITLLLGPTVQLRYIYPMMVILPFLILLQNERAEEKK